MFVFALAAGFNDGAPNALRVRALMEGFPLTPPDGTLIATAPNGAAGVSKWMVVRRDAGVGPSWDKATGLLFAGDVRLYNRPELTAELGLSSSEPERSDLELARLAYLRWKHESPLHLVGDFAFAAWDDDGRTLFAARDHLGIRPLYYRELADGVAVASDIRQILAIVDRPSDEVSGEQVLDWLSGEVRDLHRTFFRGIVRLLPGHRLLADARGVKESRYWMPPATPERSVSYAENCDRLRELFRRAVRDRLESDYPIVAHSSGGFDSSTIIMAADEVYRVEPHRSSLVMASATAPGFPSDESHYMDAVAAAVSFEGLRWSIVDETPLSFPGVSRAAPALRFGLAGGPRRDLEIARQRGARVLLGGLLGDDVWYAAGVLRDLVRHGRLVHLLRNLYLTNSIPVAIRRLVDAGLGVVSPAMAHRIADRHRRAAPPEWLGPALRHLRPAPSPRFDIRRVEWPSHLLCSIWARLTDPRSCLVVESTVEYGSEEGIEVRAPHADIRLVEYVLTIPWEQREPLGHFRRTGRDALGPLLPPEFSTRVGQKPWTSVWRATARRATQALVPFIDTGPWLSAPYVDRGIARGMLRDVVARGVDSAPQNWLHVLEFGTLEAWLRGLLR